MKNFKLLWNYMKGFRLLYAGAIAAIGLATLFSIIVPLVIRFTLDSVIGVKPMELPAWLLGLVNRAGGREALQGNLWAIGLLLVTLALLNGLFLFARGKWSAEAAESIARKIRDSVYNHLQNLPFDEMVKAKTGDLIQRCTSDVETVRRFLAMQLVEIGRALFMVGFVSSIMFSLDTKLALVAMIALPLIFTFAIVFFHNIKKAFLKADEAEGRMSDMLQENLAGVRVVRAFARQAYETEKFDQKNTEFRDLSYRLLRMFAMYWSSSDFLCLIQMCAILIAGSFRAASGNLTLGTLVVFTTYEGMLLWPVRQMGQILTDMGKTFVSLGRIQEIMDIPVEADDPEALTPPIKGDIEFHNVSFAYQEGRTVLDNISFNVRKGQTIAIMGPTGSGKTSLVNLLPRLYEYTSGSIRIDGQELKSISKKWLRENIGFVAQEPFLFSKTLRENISLANSGVEENEIHEAARIASVHDVILEFDMGYDTAVGEKGVTLSGGQKQRVTIARTVIKQYPILIFDDSMSAVDTETDAAIRRALKERSRSVTTFIISHRMTTLSEADLILVLDKGRLIQSGTHEQLVNCEGMYKKMWEIQNELEQDLQQQLVS